MIQAAQTRGEHPLTGVNNVKATDRSRRYGSDGAQPCAQYRKPWLYRLYFQPFREKTEEVIAENPGKKLVPYYTVKEFVESLETPRRILLMVKAGAGTDAAIDSLKPYLDKGDIIIDGGNTFFQDTIRRNRELSAEGFNFIGTGVSGGEEGALKGPSIMPGGQKEAYELVAPILTKIAAVAEDGEPCVTYIGADGAGHYVKMVHNGIEYGDMQLIAEAYSLLKGGLNLTNEELAQTFTEWNNGELSSYLIDITKDIFTKKMKTVTTWLM